MLELYLGKTDHGKDIYLLILRHNHAFRYIIINISMIIYGFLVLC